jgi:6-phosphofructokinase
MAKVTVKLSRKFGNSAVRAIVKTIKNSGVEKVILEDMQESIRAGKNPESGKSYKGLKDTTIKRRKRLSKFNKTHPDYSAAKSNLTFSGQLVDSMFVKVEAMKTKIKWIIDVKGRRKGYKGVRGKTLKSTSNKKVAEGLADQGRPLISISKKMQREISKKIKQVIGLSRR